MRNTLSAFMVFFCVFLNGFAIADDVRLFIVSGPAGSGSFPNHQSVLESAYKLIGVDVVFDVLPSRRSTELSKIGKIDGESLRLATYDKAVPNMIKVPTPLVESDLRVFYRAGVNYSKPEDLNGLVIATVGGGRTTIALAKKYGATLFDLQSSEQAFRFVSLRDNAHVTIFQKEPGLAMIESLGLDNMKMSEESIVVQRFYHWLQQTHSELIPKLDAAFKQLKAEGRFNVYLKPSD